MAKKSFADSATAFLEKGKLAPTEQPSTFRESFEVVKPVAMSGFRGMFGEGKLTSDEEIRLKGLLEEYGTSEELEEDDFRALSRLTSEIKAINNQSILLHGERIKKAQQVLKKYREGAFTAWLMATYGNRQTPYSMLYYYEFYHSLPIDDQPLMENLPKKAAYTLASRQGELSIKLELIRSYQGQTQKELITTIQEAFPGAENDKRVKPVHLQALDEMERLLSKLEKRKSTLTKADKLRLSLFAKRCAQLAGDKSL